MASQCGIRGYLQSGQYRNAGNQLPAYTGSFGWVWATRSDVVAQTILLIARAEIEPSRLTSGIRNDVGMLQPR